MKNLRIYLMGIFLGFMLVIPFLFSAYYLNLTVYILIMGLFAVGFNLLFGYLGKLSFGHAAFFGIGAYTVAILSYKAHLPLPLTFLAAVLISAFLALVIGYLCSRLKGMYFALVTMCFGQILFTVVDKWYSFTGGTDGIQGIPVPEILKSRIIHYYYVLAMVAAICFVLWRIVNSAFGYTLRAIRDDNIRTQFNGVNIFYFELIAFIISGATAGCAGALFAPYTGSVSPDLFEWYRSADPVIMAVFGGQYFFGGPIFGAALFMFMKNFILNLTQYWLFFLGIVIILLLVIFPGGEGILGFFRERLRGFEL